MRCGRRAVIHQAIGVIRSHFGFGEEEAFAVLRGISQFDNVKLNVIAERMVADAVSHANTPPRPT